MILNSHHHNTVHKRSRFILQITSFGYCARRQLFHQLASLPTDQNSLKKILNKNRSTAAPSINSSQLLRTTPPPTLATTISSSNSAAGAVAGARANGSNSSPDKSGVARQSTSSIASVDAAAQQPLLRDRDNNAVFETERDGTVQFRNAPGGGAAALQAMNSSSEFKTTLFPTPSLCPQLKETLNKFLYRVSAS